LQITRAAQLLERLNLDYVELAPQRGDYFAFRAWNVPPIHHNGSPRIIRKGWQLQNLPAKIKQPVSRNNS
jgi:hypothetical protein